MSEFPFWDDVCLKNAIDRPQLPPPARSLFDNDLFCNEGDIDALGDILPPLPASPLIPTPSKLLEIPSSQVTFPLDDPTQLLDLSPVNYEQIQTISEGQAFAPVPPASPGTLPVDTSLKTNIGLTPPRQWRSLLDENCPLRKRVKVTIVPSMRKRDLASKDHVPLTLGTSPPLKKPRHSQSRVTAPRRLQTTFRVPQPGDACARLTLQIPSTLSKSRIPTPSITPVSTTPGDVSPHASLGEPSTPTAQTRPVSFSLDSDLPLTSEPPGENTGRSSGRPAVDAPTVLNSELQERLFQLAHKRNMVKTSQCTFSSLPLVDAAVQAVSYAAKAYSDALSSVALPVAVSAATTFAGHRSQPAPRIVKRKGVKRRRVLLSFDDKDVKPLMDDTISFSRESVLTRYLNTSSPVSAHVKTR